MCGKRLEVLKMQSSCGYMNITTYKKQILLLPPEKKGEAPAQVYSVNRESIWEK